jgi:hypothetical protein
MRHSPPGFPPVACLPGLRRPGWLTGSRSRSWLTPGFAFVAGLAGFRPAPSWLAPAVLPLPCLVPSVTLAVCPACPPFVYFLLSLSLIPRSGEGAPPTWIEPETCRYSASACVPNQRLQKASYLHKAIKVESILADSDA